MRFKLESGPRLASCAALDAAYAKEACAATQAVLSRRNKNDPKTWPGKLRRANLPKPRRPTKQPKRKKPTRQLTQSEVGIGLVLVVGSVDARVDVAINAVAGVVVAVTNLILVGPGACRESPVRLLDPAEPVPDGVVAIVIPVSVLVDARSGDRFIITCNVAQCHNLRRREAN